MELLPARHTEAEANTEVERLERIRLQQNKAADSYKRTGARGESFLMPRRDYEQWTVREIT